MSAARLFLDEVTRIGARLTCQGDHLKLFPPAGQALPPDLVARGRELKPALLKFLRSDVEHDQRDEFEERAAICEHDGELPRSHAELIAAACLVPLASGETLARREATILHFAEHLDRLPGNQKNDARGTRGLQSRRPRGAQCGGPHSGCNRKAPDLQRRAAGLRHGGLESVCGSGRGIFARRSGPRSGSA
jgi:hypothetical protein